MSKMAVLKEKLKALQDKLGSMRAAIDQEKRDPNTEEIVAQNDVLDEIEGVEAKISLEQRVLDQEARNTAPVIPPVKPEPRSNIQIAKDLDGEKKERFLSFGEQMMAVARASAPGGSVDPRLLLIQQRAASGLSEGSPADGGFIVQTDFSNAIMENVWQNGEVPKRITRIPLSGASNGMKINGVDETSRANGSRAGGIRAYWEAEAEEHTKSKPKFRQIELKLNKLIGLCYGTDELLADATALDAFLTKAFRDEFDFQITDAVVDGNGAGKPLGILKSGCLVEVAKVSGQTAATVVYDNVNSMWSRMPYASRINAVWHINQDVEPHLNKMNLAVSTAGGALVYMPPGGASAAPYSTLFGRPVLPLEQCKTVGTVGDIILADWSKYYAIDKGDIKKDVSIHVRFLYDEQVFRFVYRFDGQPMLAGAITPANGTNTLSHFITTAVRA